MYQNLLEVQKALIIGKVLRIPEKEWSRNKLGRVVQSPIKLTQG